MPPAKKQREALPVAPDAKFAIIDGQNFIRIREAARLSNVHPVVIEMGQKLLKTIGIGGASFELDSPKAKERADDIAKTFRGGLKRVAKTLEPARKIKVKSHRDGNRLVFWFSG